MFEFVLQPLDLVAIRGIISAVELMAKLANETAAENRFCQTDVMIQKVLNNMQTLTLGSLEVEKSGVVVEDIDVYAFNKKTMKMQVSL